MRAKIENFMAIREGEIVINPGSVTVITGANMAGKTSALSALAAVLSQTTNPYSLPATRTKAYITDGRDHGAVSLVGDDGDDLIRWSLRQGEMTINKGAPEPALPVSVGLDVPHLMTANAAATFWQDLFLPPSDVLFERLQEQLQEHLTEQEIAAVVESVEINGWDKIDAVFAERSREAKRNWTKVTGQKHGVKVAADWLPAGWLTSYDGVSVAEAKRAHEQAKADLQAYHVAHAVSQADHDRGEKAKARYGPAKVVHEKAKEALKEARAAAAEVSSVVATIVMDGREIKSKRDAHASTKPDMVNPMTCPGCGAALLIKDGVLVAHDEQAFAAAMVEWEDADNAYRDALETKRTALQAAQERLAGLKNRVMDAEKADNEAMQDLAIIRRDIALLDRPLEQDNATEVERAEAEVERARVALERITERQAAKDLHQSATNYALIAQVLGTKGVRGSAMTAAMDRLDKMLGFVSDRTTWPRVRVSPEYAISLGDRATIKMCSESERWRGAAQLQIAIGRLRRDWVMLLDRVDILDDNGRRELGQFLRALLSRADPPAVVLAATEANPAASRWTEITGAENIHVISSDGVIQSDD